MRSNARLGELARVEGMQTIGVCRRREASAAPGIWRRHRRGLKKQMYADAKSPRTAGLWKLAAEFKLNCDC